MLAALSVLFLAAAGLPPLKWGGDAEGGAPFVEADPSDPSKLRGFDVEGAEEIARALGRRAEFVQVAFNSIDQSVQRGDFDIGMSGVEDTPARCAASAACTRSRNRSPPVTTSSFCRARTHRCAIGSTTFSRRACATARWSGSIGSGRSGTEINRRFSRVFSAATKSG